MRADCRCSKTTVSWQGNERSVGTSGNLDASARLKTQCPVSWELLMYAQMIRRTPKVACRLGVQIVGIENSSFVAREVC